MERRGEERREEINKKSRLRDIFIFLLFMMTMGKYCDLFLNLFFILIFSYRNFIITVLLSEFLSSWKL